jgi:competence protein ComEA
MMAHAEIVNINTANAETIAAAMNGVGASKAEAIVRYRDANGPFASLDQLAEVRGIGAKTVERNRAQLTVTGTAAR